MERINFRKADCLDVKKIAKTHINAFPGSFMSSLGVDLISKFYYEYIRENCPFWIAEKDNDIIGFCMGYNTGSHAKSNFIHNNKIRLVIRYLYLCLSFDKQAYIRLKTYLPFIIRKPQSNANYHSLNDKSARLLSICVIDKYKGNGVSQQLMDNFESELINEEVNNYTLSVIKTNHRAISFYKKNGFRIEKENSLEFVMRKKFGDVIEDFTLK